MPAGVVMIQSSRESFAFFDSKIELKLVSRAISINAGTVRLRDNGSVTRAIGRRRRLASPVMTAVIGLVAISPISRRVLVPALPRSSLFFVLD